MSPVHRRYLKRGLYEAVLLMASAGVALAFAPFPHQNPQDHLAANAALWVTYAVIRSTAWALQAASK